MHLWLQFPNTTPSPLFFFSCVCTFSDSSTSLSLHSRYSLMFKIFLYCRTCYFLPSLSHTYLGHLNFFWFVEEQVLLRLQPEALMEQVSQKLASSLLYGERVLRSSLRICCSFFLNLLIEALLKKMFFNDVSFWSSKILLPLNLQFIGHPIAVWCWGPAVANGFPVVFLCIYFCLFLGMY